jgi:hypothetical protein
MPRQHGHLGNQYYRRAVQFQFVPNPKAHGMQCRLSANCDPGIEDRSPMLTDPSWNLDLLTSGFDWSQVRSSLGSTITSTWSTVSGTLSRPCICKVQQQGVARTKSVCRSWQDCVEQKGKGCMALHGIARTGDAVAKETLQPITTLSGHISSVNHSIPALVLHSLFPNIPTPFTVTISHSHTLRSTRIGFWQMDCERDLTSGLCRVALNRSTCDGNRVQQGQQVVPAVD